MTTPFVGEIQIFGFNYAPRDWALCNGATMPISQYTALYSLIGTKYGDNGSTSFQLPNLAARTVCSQGAGQNLTPRELGETFGENQVALTINEIPVHNHGGINIYRQADPTFQKNAPANNYGLMGPVRTLPFVPNSPTPNTYLAPTTIGISGSGQGHENRQPFLALNFCIALEGEYPSFN